MKNAIAYVLISVATLLIRMAGTVLGVNFLVETDVLDGRTWRRM